MKPLRDQLGERIAPGIWKDKEGAVHFSVKELLDMVRLPDTNENRLKVSAMLSAVIRKQAAMDGFEAELRCRNDVKQTYWLNPEGTAITCIKCQKTSHNPGDVANLYCSHCHIFHEKG